MGKSLKQLIGESQGKYKRSLRKEKRTNLKNLSKQMENEKYDEAVDNFGSLYNRNVDYDLHRKFATSYCKRKYKSVFDEIKNTNSDLNRSVWQLRNGVYIIF